MQKMPDSLAPRRHGHGWVALFAAGCVLLVLAAQIVSNARGGWVFVRTAYEAGAWWQLFSAQWVHFGWPHAAWNALCMLLMLLAFRGWVAVGIQCAAWVGGYLGVAAVLAMDPACAYYAGLSGALHGYWAGSALGLWLGPAALTQRSSLLHGMAVVMLVMLVLKLWIQQGASILPHSMAFAVYHPAHSAGVAGGLLAVWVYWVFQRCAASQSPRTTGQ